MRGAFGLVGLLVVVGIIVWLWHVNHPADTVRTGRSARQQVEQFVGRDAEGMPASDSIRLSPEIFNGKLRYILVEDVVAEGPYARYFGLMRNDAIIGAGPLDLRDYDGEMAIELIQKAYQEKGRLTVIRNGQKLELPLPPGKTGTAPQSGSSSSPLQRQLEAIPGVR